MTNPPPYPADTRAKGWRFELDYERIVQSSTWALAGAEARPWLLMTWFTAWQQMPCGSLPGDESVIAAMIGAPEKVWAKHRVVLMRGWAEAGDGRLYHPTLTERVLEMQSYRSATAQRVAKHKAALREQRGGNALPTPQSHSKNDTGTGTGTGSKAYGGPPCVASTGAQPGQLPTEGEYDEAAIVGSATPTAYGAISKSLRLAGIGNSQPGLMRFRLLVDAGADAAEFLAFVPKALGIQGDRFAYIVGAVEGERKRATATRGQLHRGAMPNRQEAIEQRNAAVGDAWLAEQGAA